MTEVPGAAGDPGGKRNATGVAIRPVRPEEAGLLGAIIVEAYRELPGAPSEPEYEAELRDVATRAATSTVLVAVLDSALVGGVTYVSGPEDPYAEMVGDGEAAIRMLAVDPGAQGMGIGRALVEECIARARASGRRRVVLHTTPWMTTAQRLYDGLGFRRVPEMDWHPLPEVPLLGYALDL